MSRDFEAMDQIDFYLAEYWRENAAFEETRDKMLKALTGVASSGEAKVDCPACGETVVVTLPSLQT